MKQISKTILLVAVLAVVLIGGSVVYRILSSQSLAPGISVTNEAGTVSGETELSEAPDFTVTDIDGATVNLSDFKGTPVVLNFWASWCPPCKSEMPDFEKVYGELGKDVTFLMVNVTDGNRETTESAKDFIEENNYSFPVYFDTEQDAATVYSVRSIPTSYFINEDGQLVTGAQGAISEELLRKGISMITQPAT